MRPKEPVPAAWWVIIASSVAIGLIAGYAFHKKAYAARTGKKWATILDQVPVPA